MQLQKKYLVLFLKTLKETNLNLADSRIRDEFLKDLIEKVKSYEEAQQVIYKEFCVKDEENNPKLIEGSKFQFENDKIEALNKELETLNNEEVELTLKNPEKIKEFINVTEYKPLVGEVEKIDFIISKM